jgi:hypothetical protein
LLVGIIGRGFAENAKNLKEKKAFGLDVFGGLGLVWCLWFYGRENIVF